MIWHGRRLCYGSYNLARAVQKYPVITTRMIKNVEVLDEEDAMSITLIQIHRRRLNRLARKHGLPDFTPRRPP